ncbi:MAG: PEPxxWA-CTERM sorting domain-containing protein, partial [Thiobacillus sp.]|nr:PEPxxWA-CTERM sorting domain-containing protein [Thiobacillus sp.]
YSGEYDPETHEAFATFSDSHPNDPGDPAIYDPTRTVDLGNYLGAQNGAVNLAAAVPEPETYAMLLAGLGLVGAAVRRRKHCAN